MLLGIFARLVELALRDVEITSELIYTLAAQIKEQASLLIAKFLISEITLRVFCFCVDNNVHL